MDITAIIEKEFRHSFPGGSIKAKTRDGKLVEFVCCTSGGALGSPVNQREHKLISFIMQNWDDVKEVWEAIKAEIVED